MRFTAKDIENISYHPTFSHEDGVEALLDNPFLDKEEYPEGWAPGDALIAAVRKDFRARIVRGAPDPSAVALLLDINRCSFSVSGHEIPFNLLIRDASFHIRFHLRVFRQALRDAQANDDEEFQALRVANALLETKIQIWR
jgi:hypothetical protein